MTQYRIVADRYSGYELQAWRWWWPFWCQTGGRSNSITNTSPSLEAAEQLAADHASGALRAERNKRNKKPGKLVKYLGTLPETNGE